MHAKKIVTLVFALATTGTLLAQSPADKNKKHPTEPNTFYPIVEKVKPSGFDKKFHWGLSSNNYWSTIKGSSTAANYFAKPSLGFLISAEYFPLSFLGFGIGAGFQQRGAGIRNVNKAPVTGLNPDSTYTERLRFNTIEVPLTVILRTPKDIIKGVRFSASASLVPMINVKSNDVFNSYEAGIRQIDRVTNVSSDYFKNDFAYQFTVGPEIDTRVSGIFKVQFVYSQGTANVYKSGQGTAHNQTMGFRLSIMF